MPVTYLMTIQQKEAESLKAYVDCFNKEKLEVEGALGDLVLTALMHGVHPSCPLAAKIVRRPPATLQKFMDKAAEYINREEIIKALLTTGER